MLGILIDSIQWICLFIEGCIFLYMYNNYRKNKSNEIVMKKKTNQIILVVLLIVNVILVVTKIIDVIAL
ncbi:hypothetical protein [Clostridium sp. YIM B02551]|uniref:hypothetical protein n=1 Tax=Clostridium sp. YIM B02551 TaxID=2910679 RepID=UPI001EEAF7E0|nr:hypothetical protein [Clostridium sp. YIM B02551]